MAAQLEMKKGVMVTNVNLKETRLPCVNFLRWEIIVATCMRDILSKKRFVSEYAPVYEIDFVFACQLIRQTLLGELHVAGNHFGL